MVSPLTNLIKKDLKFEWSEMCEQAFWKTEEAVTNASELQHIDRTKKSVIESDASYNFNHSDLLHPVVVFSKKAGISRTQV